MKTFRVTKTIEFDYGHRVPSHKSQCRNVHGHRAKLEATVEGPLIMTQGMSEEGMIMDFSDIKNIMMGTVHYAFDHVFIMSVDDPLKTLLPEPISRTQRVALLPPLGDRYIIKDFGIIQEVPGVPTAENLAQWCFELLSKKINLVHRKVVQVKFWETPNSAATVSL